MADYLCVDRSALSRELGAYAERGILAFQGQQVRILDQSFSQRINFACPLPWQRTGFSGAIISLQQG